MFVQINIDIFLYWKASSKKILNIKRINFNYSSEIQNVSCQCKHLQRGRKNSMKRKVPFGQKKKYISTSIIEYQFYSKSSFVDVTFLHKEGAELLTHLNGWDHKKWSIVILASFERDLNPSVSIFQTHTKAKVERN